MNLNRNEILSRMNRIGHTILVMEKTMKVLQRKMEQQTEANARVANERFKKLETAVMLLQATAADNRTSVSHQLAESVSGIIGLKESITIRHPILKYTWIFLFCLGIGATMFFTYATTNEYLAEPTVTRVTVQKQDNYTYPPIVLCNEAWFDTQKAVELGMSIDGLKYSLGYPNFFPYTLELENISNARINFFKVFAQHKFSGLIDYYKAIAVDLELASTEESFLESPSPSYLAIGRKVDKVFLSAKTSVCYAFALPPVRGRMGALYYTLPITIKFMDKTAGALEAATSNHWMLYLSNDARSLYYWPLTITSSATTYLTIHEEIFTTFDKPNAPCMSANETNKNYTSAACMSKCANLILKKELGCQFLSLTDENAQHEPSDICNCFEINASKIYVRNRSKIDNIVEETCYEQCPHLCKKLLYTATVQGEDSDLSEFTSGSNMSVTNIQILHGAVHRGGIVTYEELTNYSFIELVNNVGGTLGMFVGGTLLTLAQLVLFFVGYICDKKNEVTIVEKLR